jgi:hypothetical protein
MGFSYFENTVMYDEYTVSYERVPQEADKPNVVKRLKKSWDGLMSDLNGLGGISLVKPDWDAVADALIKSGKHAVIFELVLTKTEFRLDVIADKVTWKAGNTKLPSDLEEYRSFLSLLSGWSDTLHDIVPTSDFKKFNDNNPRKPEKPKAKDYEALVKLGKAPVDAFRAWAKSNSNAKKAFDAIDKTAKSKPTDPARVAALKAINLSLLDYLKSF